ncbi:MAG: hypothetical protein ACLR3R_18510 [Clostridium paraputrificum]
MSYTCDKQIRTFEVKGKPYEEVLGCCKRCGGTGHFSYNPVDGTKCYGCGGTGYQRIERRILTEKEKAQRERAKTRRKEKQEKEREANRKKSIEINNKKFLERNGFENTENIYLVLNENSYEIKEELKEKGAFWNNSLKSWCFRESIEDYQLLKVNYNDFISKGEYGAYMIDVDKLVKVLERKNTSEYINAEIGEKIELDIEVINIHGYSATIKYMDVWTNIVTMRDNDGNILVWKTQSDSLNKGDKVRIKAIVKEFSDYEYKKQTILKNVRIVK